MVPEENSTAVEGSTMQPAENKTADIKSDDNLNDEPQKAMSIVQRQQISGQPRQQLTGTASSPLHSSDLAAACEQAESAVLAAELSALSTNAASHFAENSTGSTAEKLHGPLATGNDLPRAEGTREGDSKPSAECSIEATDRLGTVTEQIGGDPAVAMVIAESTKADVVERSMEAADRVGTVTEQVGKDVESPMVIAEPTAVTQVDVVMPVINSAKVVESAEVLAENEVITLLDKNTQRRHAVEGDGIATHASKKKASPIPQASTSGASTPSSSQEPGDDPMHIDEPAAPSKAAPSKGASKGAPSKIASLKAAPSKAAPPKAAPSKATPTKVGPTKADHGAELTPAESDQTAKDAGSPEQAASFKSQGPSLRRKSAASREKDASPQTLNAASVTLERKQTRGRRRAKDQLKDLDVAPSPLGVPAKEESALESGKAKKQETRVEEEENPLAVAAKRAGVTLRKTDTLESVAKSIFGAKGKQLSAQDFKLAKGLLLEAFPEFARMRDRYEQRVSAARAKLFGSRDKSDATCQAARKEADDTYKDDVKQLKLKLSTEVYRSQLMLNVEQERWDFHDLNVPAPPLPPGRLAPPPVWARQHGETEEVSMATSTRRGSVDSMDDDGDQAGDILQPLVLGMDQQDIDDDLQMIWQAAEPEDENEDEDEEENEDESRETSAPLQ
ncbi:hypothetical protein HDU96_003024 [Phlyctochytrium bullatum]|nr:hypothetical protein HDU96_003024 [Phlyctochytrium bullatum]